MRDSTRLLVRDYGGTILIALTVALVVRFFVIEAYRIPSPAMRPTLEPGDTIFVGKWPFDLHLPGVMDAVRKGRAPRRGEVVVFSYPSDPRRDYIKRVVGLPGETIQVTKGRVSIDGKPIPVVIEKNASCGTERLPGDTAYEVCWEPPLLEDFGPEKVPEHSVFVVGDYRSQAMPDAHKNAPGAPPAARTWGFVNDASIKGKALWIWLSIEPQSLGAPSGWFPHFRFDRMFRRIE